MDLNKFFQSKNFKVVFILIGALIVCLLSFQAGLIVGFKKANFSFRWGENYHRNFGGPGKGFGSDFGDRNFIDAFGTFGQIIKIEGSSLVIKGREDIEKIVLVSDQTIIKRFQDNIKLTDLKVDDYIVIIGEPNTSGQTEAKLIRVMPTPPTATPPLPLRR